MIAETDASNDEGPHERQTPPAVTPQGPGGPEIRGSDHHAVAHIARLCTTFQIESLLPQIRVLEELAGDTGVLDVTVVGRFKAGKSSFLNHVIGRAIMPVGVLPVTAIVTRLSYGPRERVIVHRLNGEEEEIELARLPEFVTEERNPRNVKQVTMVDVELPDLDGYRGLRFVDTPGLGSVFAHNTRATRDWLPRAGISFLAISVDQPLSEEDLGLLQDLARQTPGIAILATKADLMSPPEMEAVVEFIRRQTASLLKTPPRVFPYSIRGGYEGLRAEVRDYLVAARDRGSEMVRSVLDHKIRTLVEECLSYLRMALAATRAAEESRQSLRRQLSVERGELDQVRHEIRILIEDLKRRVRTETYERFEGEGPAVFSRCAAELRAAQDAWQGNLRQTVGAFQDWLRAYLPEVLAPLSAEIGDALARDFLDQARGSLARVVQAFQDRLAGHIARALHISPAGATFTAEVASPRRPDLSIDRVFDSHLDILWFLVPMRIFRPLVRNHLRRRLSWEVEKNLARLGSQWSSAIERCLDHLAGEAESFIDRELTTVESLVAVKQDRSGEIERAINALEGMTHDPASRQLLAARRDGGPGHQEEFSGR